MSVLDKMTFRKIDFDPANPEHRAIYWQLRTTGRQHPEIRFSVPEPFTSVLTMMTVKIADHFSAPREFEVTLIRKGIKHGKG